MIPRDLGDEVERVKLIKQEACERDGGPSDLMPMLVYHYEENGKQVVGIFMIQDTQLLTPSLNFAEQKWGAPQQLVFIADSFIETLTGDEAKDRIPQRGDLTQRFERGDMSVKEALVVTIADRDGMVLATLPYHYDDSGMPVWDEVPDFQDAEPSGLVPEALQAALR